VDVLFSLAYTLAGLTLPADYDQGQLIGAVSTNSSSNIITFVQEVNYFRILDPVSGASDATPPTSLETVTLAGVPPNSLVSGYVTVQNDTGPASDLQVSIAYVGATDSVANEVYFDLQNTSATINIYHGAVTALTDASAQIDWAVGAGYESVSINMFAYDLLKRGRVTA
jgi:hypothetical protein